MTSQSQVPPRTRRFIMAIDRFVLFVTQYWLLLAITFLLIFAGLPFLAPVLMHAGVTALAELIYKAYSFTCHQLAYRTFFFFGDKPAYTIDELQRALGVTNDASDALFWREFLGNARTRLQDGVVRTRRGDLCRDDPHLRSARFVPQVHSVARLARLRSGFRFADGD